MGYGGFPTYVWIGILLTELLVEDLTHIPLEDTPEISPTVY